MIFVCSIFFFKFVFFANMQLVLFEIISSLLYYLIVLAYQTFPFQCQVVIVWKSVQLSELLVVCFL